MKEKDALVRNAADREQVGAAETREKLHGKHLAASWNAVLSSADGRAVLFDVLQQCGIWTGGFSGDRAHYNEGQRNVGLFVLAKIDEQPDKYALMMRENNKEK